MTDPVAAPFAPVSAAVRTVPVVPLTPVTVVPAFVPAVMPCVSKLVELEDDGQNEHDVAFDGIKDVIIQGIRNAKYTIWVAVAWFSDRDIFQELLAKKKQGISIRIITSNEKSNMTLMSELESNFEVVKVPLKGAYLSNRLHDKFCIIDFEFVMRTGAFFMASRRGYPFSGRARRSRNTAPTHPASSTPGKPFWS